MESHFDKLVSRYMKKRELMDILYAGSKFQIFYNDSSGSTIFKEFGFTSNKSFEDYRPTSEVVDIVCGALEVMDVKYDLSYHETEISLEGELVMIVTFIIEEIHNG
jgi:hypothetical protein